MEDGELLIETLKGVGFVASTKVPRTNSILLVFDRSAKTIDIWSGCADGENCCPPVTTKTNVADSVVVIAVVVVVAAAVVVVASAGSPSVPHSFAFI